MATTARGAMSSSKTATPHLSLPVSANETADVERTLRTIFKRCVQCPPDVPTCPTCPDGRICVLQPQDCTSCASMTCIKNPNSAPTSSGPNVGAIAGGVVGGIAFVVVVVFLVYWFWIKKRREEQDAELEDEWQHEDIASQKRNTRFTATHDAASTRTRGSLANSILSRASNIIQIAYIPGVTNRNGSGRNSVHAPVPPIPAAHRGGSQPPKSPLSNEGDALFFRPGDLRDSTWSGASSITSGNRDTRYSNNRDTRYTMASISPSLMRDSVATDSVFWDDAATQPMPASTAARPTAAARMVSVKSSNSSEAPGSTHTSATPEEDGKVKMLQVMMPGQGSSLSPNPSVKSSSSSTFAKVKQVTVGGAKGKAPSREVSNASATSSGKHVPAVSSPLAEQTEEPVDTEEDRTRQSLIKNIDFATPPAVQPAESPFFDASEAPPRSGASSPKLNPYASMASTISTSTNTTSPVKRGSRNMNRLSAVVEEQKRASQEVSDSEDKRDHSPFSDEHATE